MDARVNDFFDEINDIVPSQNKSEGSDASDDWQECLDKGSGFTYYWNVGTNAVTWEKPLNFKPTQKANIDSLPKPAAPATVKGVRVYSIAQALSITELKKPDDESPKNHPKKVVDIKARRSATAAKNHKSESDDEKIVLISSYGGDTDSEDDADDTNMTDAEIVSSSLKPQSNRIVPTSREASKLTGIALLANYNDVDDFSDDDNDNEEELKRLFPIAPPPECVPTNTTAASTLFPIAAPINISQFAAEPQPVPKIEGACFPEPEESIKVAGRKKRIAVELVNVQRKHVKVEFAGDEKEHSKQPKYTGFTSGGLMLSGSTGDGCAINGCGEVKEVYDILREKLDFLCEGNKTLSPVQLLFVQLQTLHDAYLDGSLQKPYLSKWLTDTNKEISQLERDSPPNGWFMEWDRKHKRYHYRHSATGRGQWDFPQGETEASTTGDNTENSKEGVTTSTASNGSHSADTASLNHVTDDDDAMDISTTPPPEAIPEVTPQRTELPPLPLEIEPLIPPPPPPPEEPLPPGIEGAEIQLFNESLSSALNSFYSDIAAIESTTSADAEAISVPPVDSVAPSIPVKPQLKLVSINTSAQPSPKAGEQTKKKKKVKLSQGIAMKKKDINNLVEKWKHAQKDME